MLVDIIMTLIFFTSYIISFECDAFPQFAGFNKYFNSVLSVHVIHLDI